jgi:hypothetical protein
MWLDRTSRSRADTEASHWDYLTRILREQGVEVEAAELKALAHDVELSDRVLARIGRGRPASPGVNSDGLP